MVDPGEDCDDQDADNNDGCLDTCKDRPLLWFQFEGDLSNDGWLGPTFDGQGGTAETYETGHDGQAVAFNGASIIVPGTNIPLSAGPRYTVALWFREDLTVMYPNGVRLLDFRISDGGGIETYPGSSTRIFQCYSGLPDGSGCLNFDYTRGAWHHLLYRCDGTEVVVPGGCDVEIFVDGVYFDAFETEGNVVFAPSQAEDMRLGSGVDFLMDDLRIYDTVFDPQGQCETVIEGTWDGVDCVMP